ncbi:CLUMA_CG003390, isoform A, partial [Clunio marinus]
LPNRLESRDKFSRSKSPNIFNRKTIESSTPAIAKSNPPDQKQQRARTASMPAENRKPRLADTRRSAIHCADMDIEYYRLRSFSITSHGICNLGDSMRSRRSRSINSVTSSNSGRDRNNSTGSQHMDEIKELSKNSDEEKNVAYKIAMLGDSAVGKTALTYQFTTSEYICAYDLSLDDDYGQKTVSVLLNNQETDLEIIDHPSCEMSVEAFCSTYSIDLFVIVYSVVDRKTFKTAERILLYLKENEMMLTRGAILVGNKTDLERQREVTMQAGKKLAKEIGCKFIETSSGLDHNVDELLVGIVAQVKLNPQRIRNLSEKQRNSLCTSMQQKYLKGTADHFTQLRRNERNKSNKKHAADATRGKGGNSKNEASNKENVNEAIEDETDDERSTDDGEESDIEKYFNLDDKTPQHSAKLGEGSAAMNLNKMLNSRRYATPGMNSHYESVNPFFNNNKSNVGNSNNNLSSSSCSTPTSIYPSAPGTSSSISTNQTKTNKRDLTSYDTNTSVSQPTTPKKSNLSGAESDSNDRCINRFSNRTKLFLTSFLKFKRSLRVKRRNSNSCSNLFVI